MRVCFILPLPFLSCATISSNIQYLLSQFHWKFQWICYCSFLLSLICPQHLRDILHHTENFSPGWNSRPVNQAEVSAWPFDKILKNQSSWLYKGNFSPVWATLADISAWLTGRKTPCNCTEKIRQDLKDKTTKVTDEFLSDISSDLSYSPGWNISCNEDFFQPSLPG